MRIRKHAKISPLVYAAASLHPGAALLQTHVCQLNQSPWDVMDFSRPPPTTTHPPPHQVPYKKIPLPRDGGRICLHPPAPPPFSSRTLLHFFCAACYFRLSFFSAFFRVFCRPAARVLQKSAPIRVIGRLFRLDLANYFVGADAAPAANGSCGGRFSAGKSNYTGQQSEYSDDPPAKTAALKSEEPLILPPPPPPPPPAAEQNEPGKITICSKTDGKNWKCKREASGGNTMCDHHLSQVRSYSYSSAAKKPVPEPRRPARPKKAPSSNPHDFYYYSGFGPRWAKKRGADCNNTSASASANGNIEHGHGIEKNYSSSEDKSEYDEPDYEDSEEDEEEEKKGRKRGRKPIKARSLKSLM
ncbi:Putative membrane lipoprotein [Striga hermonthica]|uniref:Membrane lipoprotein n=1 Tax=Striga hermonthica TaxID=68872 RepID=A0A9N7N6D6_STRHE|nr:Putative membrane lipoprotein [Striga hermonthica]